MKCVIFCGGKGTRLREETKFIPKPLVEVGGYPILWHIMKIYSSYGVKDFILPLGYKGDLIIRYFMEYQWRNSDVTLNLKSNQIKIENDNEIDDWNITFVDTGLESKTALRLYKVKKYLEGEDNFCLTYGDGVANVNIKNLIDYHLKYDKIVSITGLHPRSKYGLMLKDENNIITKFEEKPILKESVNGGFMVIKNQIFDYLTNENLMLVESVLPQLAKEGQIKVYNFNGFWHCMDTYRDYEDLNRIWEEQPLWKVW